MIRLKLVIISVLLVCIVFSGCTGSATMPQKGVSESAGINNKTSLVGDIPVSFPLSSEPSTLKILITGYNGNEQENVFVWQEYERMTGVNVDWLTVSRETRAEEVYTSLINGKSLDLILRCKLSANRLTQYAESGLILDLAKDGMLRDNAPNCWKYLQSHPDTLASVMNPDGTIYALPQVNSGAELRVALKLYINKQWLERLNMSIPSSTEELRELLLAFKQQDANGNGDPDDEIPMCSADWDSVKLSLYGAFGLANRGYHNTTVDCDPKSGGLRLLAASDAYRSFLEYMHGLYADGLINQNVFTISADSWAYNADQDKIGMFFSTNLASLPADKVDNWVAVDQALTGPDGDKLWTAIRANFHSTGAAVIPATCKDPALALRWLDYFWTDEGTLFYHMGVEGETFYTLEDGSYDYLPEIYEKMRSENRSFDDVIAEYSPYPGGSNPTVEIAPYFKGGEMADVPAQAARALIEYGPTEYWPSFTFSAEENETLSTLRTDIEKYCNNMQIDFITGAVPLSEWESYIAQLNKLKKDELLSIYQTAVDRYHALSTALE